jgi:hypothetical protein
MTTPTRWQAWALLMGAALVSFNKLSLGSKNREAKLKTPNQITEGEIVALSKQPELTFTTYNLGLCAGLTKVAAAEAVPAFTAVFREYEENKGLTGAFKTFALLNVLMHPTQLTGNLNNAATLNVTAKVLFDAQGNAITIGSAVKTDATLNALFTEPGYCYYPKQVVFHGTPDVVAIDISDVNISWNYQLTDNDQVAPVGYFLEELGKTGTIKLKDLANVTIDRLIEGTTENISIVFEDRKSGGADITFPLGTVKVKADIDDREAVLNITGLAELDADI